MSPDPSKASRGRTVLLVGSLCLNVVLIASIAVGLSRAVQNGGFIAQPGGQLAPAAIARGLNADGQSKIRGIVTEHQDAVREARQAARRARVNAFRVFAAPTYTPEEFTKALEQVRAADSLLEEEAILRLRDTINSLTPEERKTVVDRVRSGANRPLWRRLFQPTPRQPQG